MRCYSPYFGLKPLLYRDVIITNHNNTKNVEVLVQEALYVWKNIQVVEGTKGINTSSTQLVIVWEKIVS